jgi:hypothetical protein
LRIHARRSEEKAVIEETIRHSGLDPESRIVFSRREAPQKFPSSLAREGGPKGRMRGRQPQKIRMTNWIPGQARNDEVLGVSPGVASPSPGGVRECWVSASLQPSLRPVSCLLKREAKATARRREEIPRHSGLDPESRIVFSRREAPQKFPSSLA